MMLGVIVVAFMISALWMAVRIEINANEIRRVRARIVELEREVESL